METVILCNGQYAKTPYCVEGDGTCLYSVEELCYYLYKNAFLLQDDFSSKELYQWLTLECKLEAWASTLKKMQEESAQLLDMMVFLFENKGFYDEKEIEAVRKVLQGSSHLSIYEKKKIRADAYFKRGRIAKAALEYEELLKETEYANEKFRARLLHNLGVCDAVLFQYKKAAEEFKRAYRTYPNTESYVQYLSALKLSMSKEEYLAYLSEHKESYEDSLEVERRVSQIESDMSARDLDLYLNQIANEKETSYYETIIQLTRQAKDDYLNMISKG